MKCTFTLQIISVTHYCLHYLALLILRQSRIFISTGLRPNSIKIICCTIISSKGTKVKKTRAIIDYVLLKQHNFFVIFT